MAQMSQKRKGGWLFNYDQHLLSDCQSKEEEGLPGTKEEESQFLTELAPSHWLKFPLWTQRRTDLCMLALLWQLPYVLHSQPALSWPCCDASVCLLLSGVFFPHVFLLFFCVLLLFLPHCCLVSVTCFWIPVTERWLQPLQVFNNN